MRNYPRWIAAAAAALAFGASCGGNCGGSASTAPIVGYWTFKGGVVDIRAKGSGYEGVIVRRPTDGACAEPLGYILLKLNGSGSHYTGQEEWWEDPGCERLYSKKATVDVSGATAHLCSDDPFPGPPPSECADLSRLASLPSST